MTEAGTSNHSLRVSKSSAVTRLSETSSQIAYGLSWSSARYSGYAGDHVRYATRTGASATITFTGKSVAWIGPVGPTRGTARVFIDGKAAGKVDLRRSTFDSRSVLFSKAFGAAGPHTMTIVVTSSGRPVAIDEILVGT